MSELPPKQTSQINSKVYLKKGVSARRVVKELRDEGINISQTSVSRGIKQMGLKPFRINKTQRLTVNHRHLRVKSANLWVNRY